MRGNLRTIAALLIVPPCLFLGMWCGTAMGPAQLGTMLPIHSGADVLAASVSMLFGIGVSVWLGPKVVNLWLEPQTKAAHGTT